MSASFGVCEPALGNAGNAFYNTLWEQAAAQGITVMVSAGDGGSDGCDDFNTATMSTSGISVSGTASTPFNVAVGGTDFDDVGKQTPTYFKPGSGNDPLTLESALGYIPETTWNDSCAATATTGTLATCNPGTKSTLNIVGGSGGPSSVYLTKPTWQTGFGDSARDIPDVSLFASDGPKTNSFYLVCQQDAVAAGGPPSCAPSVASKGFFSFQAVGGTSASSPAFAAIIALINQNEAIKTGNLTVRQGNANYILYSLAKAEAPSLASCNSSKQTNPNVPPPAACVFNDITTGNNSVPCAGGSHNCSSTTANTNGVLVNSAKAPAFTTGTGYDLATGLGSVNVTNLANAWAAFETTLKTTATTVSSHLPVSLNNIPHRTQTSFTVSVAPSPAAASTPSGTVSLLSDANPNLNPPSSGVLGEGAAILDGTGSATISTNSLPGGSYNVSVHYPGDNVFGPSDSSKIPVAVTQEQSQLQLDLLSFGANNSVTINPTSLVYGSSYILRADILNSSAGPCQPFVLGGGKTGCATDATGAVAITDNGSSASPNGGTFALNSLGHTENQPIQLLPGKHTLSATYSGDSSYITPKSPATATVTVTQAGTTTAVTASPTSIASGGSVMLTATVTSTQFSGDAPGAPGGKLLAAPVQFLNGTTPISGTIKLVPSPGSANSPSLTATLTTTVSALGIPDTTSPWRPRLPPVLFLLLGCSAALYGLLLWKMHPARRRGYAYAGLVFFGLAAAGIAGCGGGSSKTPQSKTVTITANFSGDSNYTASSGTTTVTVQ
jgi:hypothetical protein